MEHYHEPRPRILLPDEFIEQQRSQSRAKARLERIGWWLVLLAAIGLCALPVLLPFMAHGAERHAYRHDRVIETRPAPLVKSGQCPSGWIQSGGYCMTTGGDVGRAAVPKVGQCPSGYRQSGNYCQEMRP